MTEISSIEDIDRTYKQFSEGLFKQLFSITRSLLVIFYERWDKMAYDVRSIKRNWNRLELIYQMKEKYGESIEEIKIIMKKFTVGRLDQTCKIVEDPCQYLKSRNGCSLKRNWIVRVKPYAQMRQVAAVKLEEAIPMNNLKIIYG